MDDAARLALIAEAVRYCQRVAAMGMPAACYTKALREPIFFLWETRRGPKAKAARYRSRQALGMRFGQGELVYDHAVPFVLLQRALMALQPVNEETVGDVLNRYGVAVLITKAEHRRLDSEGFRDKMPATWDELDPLARYRAAGIELVENI